MYLERERHRERERERETVAAMSLVAYLLFDGHTLHILMGSLLILAIFDIIAKVYVGCKDHEVFFFVCVRAI